MKPKPTLHETVMHSRTGKLPESYHKRLKAWEEQQAKAQAELDEQAKDQAEEETNSQPKAVGDSQPTEDEKQVADESKADPEADNTFENLPEDTEFPYGYGGGMFWLSDGTKVRGEEAAKKAQAELDKG